MSSYACNNNVRETDFCALMTIFYHTSYTTKIKVSKALGPSSPWFPIQPDLPRAAGSDKNTSCVTA